MLGSIKKSLSSFEILKLAENHARIGIWSHDIQTGELKWSPGLCRILGVDPIETKPSFELYRDLIHPADRMDFALLDRSTTERLLDDRRFRILRPDGALRWLTSRSERVYHGNGQLVHLVGVVTDVTAEQESRMLAYLQGEQIRALCHLSELAVWYTRPDGSAVEAQEWQKKSGQSATEVSGWGRLAAVHPEDVEIVKAAWEYAISTGEAYAADFRIRCPDGNYQAVRSRGLPVRNPIGGIEGWIGVIRNNDYFRPLRRKSDEPTFVAGQIRAARGFLGWSGRELAARAKVSFSTVRRLEDLGSKAVNATSARAVRLALESAGVTFAQDNEGRWLVRYDADGTGSDRGTARATS